MSQTNGQVSALVALISDAAKIVEANFAKSSQPYVPSLDDTKPHPLDEVSNAELRNAIQIIEGACAQLSATVARPSHTLVNKFMGFFESTCFNVVLTFKIPDILQQKPVGMHISEIAQKSGIEEGKIGRILRLLATKHVFREVSKDVFANNRLSIQLLSHCPLSSCGLHITEHCVNSAVFLNEVLADKEWGPSYAPNHTAFNRCTSYPGSIFTYFEQDRPKGVERGARFGIAMIGWGAAIESQAVVTEFPWNKLPEGASVCDVGGGIGNITMMLAKSYPKLQVVLQDQPRCIDQAKNEVWPKQCPEAIAEGRIKFEALDFLAESPVQGCHIYYLKNIVHDWPDAECVKILSNVRDAMLPHSRVLVRKSTQLFISEPEYKVKIALNIDLTEEYILQYASRLSDDQSAFAEAPEPLLPNFGAGRIRQYNLDLDMMVDFNSEERRLADFIRLGKAAGLKFVKLWDLGETGLIEYQLPANFSI